MQAPFADPLSGLELLSKALPLVGRETEMQTTRALLDSITLNRPTGPRAIMISGEMGVGKTRLLAEIYLEARARGFRVLEGHTYTAANIFPYLPFIEALRPVLRHATPEELRRYVGLADPRFTKHDPSSTDTSASAELQSGTPVVAALARFFPELPGIVATTITPEVLSADQEKFRLFDSVATFLERMALERPVLLGIDNLQWADSGSLELTMYLSVRLHSSHIALVGVTRPPITPNDDDPVVTTVARLAATRALGDLVRHGLLQLLPLGPLGAEAADQHLHALLPRTLSQEVAQSLLGRAEGNPFFLEELVRMLTLNQLLVLCNGEWRATRAISTEIPESITLAVGQRLQGLSASCRELLCIASLFGRTFPLDALVQTLDQPEDEVEALINEAARAVVIAKVPGVDRNEFINSDNALPPLVSTTFLFCQGIVQEVLNAEVPPSRARLLHGAIGAALEASYANAAPAHAAELAYHYALSSDKPAALRWSLLAGEEAARQQAHREAIGHFRLALGLLEAGTDVVSPAQLYLLMGESWFKLGELEQAAQAFQHALTPSIPGASGQTALLLAQANRQLADIYRMQGKYDQALAYLQAATSAFDAMADTDEETNGAATAVPWFPGRSFLLRGSDLSGPAVCLAGTPSAGGTRSLAHMSTNERILLLQAQATLDMLLGRTQEAEIKLWQSHQLATENGDRGSQAFALQLLSWLRGWGERIHEAIRFQEQAYALYVAVGDPFRAALVDQVLGIVYQALGDMERARLCTQRGFERARRYGARRILGLLHWNYGVMALAQGDWAGSDSRLQQAWQEAETHNDTRLKPVVLQAQAELQFRRGNWQEAEQLFQASIKAASATEWIASAIALYGHFLAVIGRRKAAQEQLDRAAVCPEPSGLAGSFYIPFLAEGYLHLGANEQAAAYIKRIRAMRGCMYYGISVDRVLGVVATLAGDWETAQQAFEDGLALCRRAHNEPEEAAILYEQARAALMHHAIFSEEVRRQNLHALCDRARALLLRYHMQRAADLVDTLQQGVRALEQSDGGAMARVTSPAQAGFQQSFSIGPHDRTLTLRLTGRELEVLRLVAEGHTDREVADILVISPRTVNRHLSNIFVKLDVSGRAAAVAYAIRQGIVS